VYNNIQGYRYNKFPSCVVEAIYRQNNKELVPPTPTYDSGAELAQPHNSRRLRLVKMSLCTGYTGTVTEMSTDCNYV